MGSLHGARLEVCHPPFIFTSVDLFRPRNCKKIGLSVNLPYKSKVHLRNLNVNLNCLNLNLIND